MQFNRFHTFALIAATAGIPILFANERALAAVPSVQVVAYTGEQAPGMPAGVTYQYLTPDPAINNAGMVVYGSTPPSNSGTAGIWIENHGLESLLYQAGTQAPGVPSGDKFQFFHAAFGGGASGFIANDNGQIAFAANINSPTSLQGYSTGVWSDASGALTATGLQGNPVPGFAAGWTFSNLPTNGTGQRTTLWFNDEGDVAFLGEAVVPAGPSYNYSYGIWSTTGGSLQVVAAQETPAPGTATGVVFENNGSPTMPAFNPKGQVAFFGELAGTGIVYGTNDTGLWAQNNGTLALVARAGGPAPGTSAGTYVLQIPLWILQQCTRI